RSGPNLDRLQPPPPNPSWRSGRDYMVGYVGVMGPQEGLPFLLDAARFIAHDMRRHDIQFCLVGSGSEIEMLKALARKLDIDSYVTFTGRVSDDVLLEV